MASSGPANRTPNRRPTFIVGILTSSSRSAARKSFVEDSNNLQEPVEQGSRSECPLAGLRRLADKNAKNNFDGVIRHLSELATASVTSALPHGRNGVESAVVKRLVLQCPIWRISTAAFPVRLLSRSEHPALSGELENPINDRLITCHNPKRHVVLDRLRISKFVIMPSGCPQTPASIRRRRSPFEESADPGAEGLTGHRSSKVVV